MEVKKILVLELGGIGDTVMTLPALRALKEAFPGAHLDVALVQKAPFPILAKEFCDRSFLIPYDLLHWREFYKSALGLRRECYDLCFAASGAHPWKAGLFAWLAGAKVRLGERRGRFPAFFYTHTVRFEATCHIVESNENILAGFGIPVRHKLPSLEVRPEHARTAERFFAERGLLSRQVIGLHLGSVLLGGAKSWPTGQARRFSALLKEQRGEARVLLFGSSDEAELCAEAAEKMGDITVPAAGQPLLESIALLARCAAFVGPDGGLAHLASALGVPCVVLFGPTDPRRFRPRGRWVRVIQEYCRDMRSDVAREGKHKCIGRISPERIFVELTTIGF